MPNKNEVIARMQKVLSGDVMFAQIVVATKKEKISDSQFVCQVSHDAAGKLSPETHIAAFTESMKAYAELLWSFPPPIQAMLLIKMEHMGEMLQHG